MWQTHIYGTRQYINITLTKRLRAYDREKHKDKSIKDYDFTCSLVWVWSLNLHRKGRAQIEAV
jgi:hypothetical protein